MDIVKRIFFVILFFTLTGCKNKAKQNISVYKMLASGLNDCNILIDNENLKITHEIERKISNPATNFTALIWKSKVDSIKVITQETINYIDSLKILLKHNAGMSLINGNYVFREDDEKAVIITFEQNNTSEKLKRRILKYEKDVLNVDKKLKNEFENYLANTIKLYDPTLRNKSFYKTFFSDIPTVGCIAILIKFQNSIKVLENKLINYFNYQIPS